jgi:hypothetical protein
MSQEVAPRSAREKWFAEQLTKPEIAGVVFYLPPSDHMAGWDYPAWKKMAEEAGKSTLLIRADALDAEGRNKIAEQAKEFAAGLKPLASASQGAR